MRFVIQSYGSKFLQCCGNVVAMLGNVLTMLGNVLTMLGNVLTMLIVIQSERTDYEN